MRIFLLLVILISSIVTGAQTSLPGGFMDYMQRENYGYSGHSVPLSANKKWFYSTYSGISTSYNFFNGGDAIVVSAPMGLQLTRRLNNNLYAFAGISVAPAYINFNHSFLTPAMNKSYPNNGMFNSNSFDIYSKAELGLMYVNDARTFSVSGSIGVERSNYPRFPYRQMDASKPNRVTPPTRN